MKSFFWLLCCVSVLPLAAQDDEVPRQPMEQANYYMRKQLFSLAEEIYRLEYVKHPEDHSVMHLLSHSLMNQKKFHEADSFLKISLNLDTNQFGALWYMGLLNEKQNKDTTAILFFKQYITKTNGKSTFNANVHWMIANSYRKIMADTGLLDTQFDDMVHHLNKFATLKPDDFKTPEVNEFLGKIKDLRPAPNQRVRFISR